MFEPLRDALLTQGDYYMYLVDLRPYLDADHQAIELFANPEE